MQGKISDVCSQVYSGGTPNRKHDEYYSGGSIPWLNTAEVKFNRIYSTEKYITDAGLKASSAKWVPANSVIVAMYGATAARTAIAKIPLTTNQACCNLIINDEIADFRYVYYWLYLKYNELASLANGGAQQNLNAGQIKDFPIIIPELHTQRAIADMLSSVDDKIETNNRINQNLLQQMESLYKAWFIDYVPFEGKRPSDWLKADIYTIADIIYGAPFASKLFNTDGEGIPIIRIRDLNEQSFVTYTTEKHPKGHLIQPGDIVVGMDGEFRPYIWGNTTAWLNQRVCIFDNKRPKGKAFVLFTIKPLLYRIEQTQVATTVIHIGKKDFDAFEFFLPDENTLVRFDEITSPMIECIVGNRLENKRLSELRDCLLPKLMSGELNISEIEL